MKKLFRYITIGILLILIYQSSAQAATFIKQSTAVVISMGPFVDKTDGVTFETGLVGTGANQLESTSSGIMLSKNGGTMAVRHATATASAYDAYGMYKVTLDTTDTGTLGKLRISFGNNDALPVWVDCMIVTANIWDSLFSTDILNANVTTINDIATTSVTAVNANVGTTQPINFTGTGATAYPKVDVTDIATAAVSATTAQLGVNVVNWKGSAAAAMTGDAYSKVSSLTFSTANQVDARVLTNSDKTGYTASTVSDKTGYSLTQTFPTNFSSMSISATTGLVDITQAAADKVWSTAARVLTAGTNIALAKGTGVTGFNDIAATDVLNVNISAYSGAGYAGTYLKAIYDKLPAGTIGTSTYAGGAVASVTGAVGSISGVTFPTNFEHLAITDTTGLVSVGTNNDKTGYTASTVSDKTGYSLTQTFPTNFSALSISATTGLVDITQAAADKVWGTAARVLTAGTNIVLAKGTGITGFNDFDTAGIAGAVWNAITASYGTANTYGALLETNLDTNIGSRGTGTSTLTAANVWQTDISAYSTSGQAGTYLKAAGGAADPWLTNLPGSYEAGTAGYVIGHNLDTTVGSRMATFTYTAPDNAGITNIYNIVNHATYGNNALLTAIGTRSSHSAADVAALMLVTPANKLATDSSGRTTVGSNADKAGYTISGTKTTLDSLNDITAASVWGVTSRTLTAGGFSGLSEADIDLIWNEVMSGHVTTGTAGKYLLDAQAAGNPWATDISTGYTGQAGEVIRRIDKNTKMVR